jgi:hypothetical protein
MAEIHVNGTERGRYASQGQTALVKNADLDNAAALLNEAIGCNEAHHFIAKSDEHSPYVGAALSFCVNEMEKRLGEIEEILAKLRGARADDE